MKIETIEVTNPQGLIEEHIVITHDDGSLTSMPKSVWDELEAAKNAEQDYAETLQSRNHTVENPPGHCG